VQDIRDRKYVFSELAIGPTTPIHIPFAAAIPGIPVIDSQTCIHMQTGGCGICSKVCEPEAIDYEMQDTFEEMEVGSIILATGFKTFDPEKAEQYGYGKLDNVMTSLEFEHLSHASGPTGGAFVKADGTEPKSVAILHCIGSRDKNYNEYCSRVCCMYSLKIAHLIREKVPDADIYELYIDMRCPGSGYEEFYNRLLEEGVHFIRGKGVEVSKAPTLATTAPIEGNSKLYVKCEDTLLGMPRELPVDMVILSVGLEPTADAEEIARVFKITSKADGFFMEKHPKLAPVDTLSDGIFIAGCAQGPKDIPDSVAQGAAAASAAMSLIDAGEVALEPITSVVDEDVCTGCKTCLLVCPYGAITRDEEKGVAVINDALCKACGCCVAACPSGAITQRGFDDTQIEAELAALLMS
jgi:heterodisulfide reductase subunit A